MDNRDDGGSFVDIPDEFEGHNKELFCVPAHYLESIASVLIPHGVIQERIKKIARDILIDVLEEDETQIDPTENICSDDSVAGTSVDLMIDKNPVLKEDSESPTAYYHGIQNLNNISLTMEEDPLAITITPDFSYNLDLHYILDDSDYPALEDTRQDDDTTLQSEGQNCDEFLDKRQASIGVKSFAKVRQKHELVHFLCILKTQTPYVEMLRKMNCPSVKGGYKFFLDLLDHVNKLNSGRSKTSIQVALDFIKVDSIDDTVNIDGVDDVKALKGANIVVVEDIVDTGKIMAKLVAKLQEFSPKKILIACLLRKRSRVQCYTPDYTGFQVPNKFLVGYALDFNEYFRDLMHICVLSRAGVEKYKN